MALNFMGVLGKKHKKITIATSQFMNMYHILRILSFEGIPFLSTSFISFYHLISKVDTDLFVNCLNIISKQSVKLILVQSNLHA